MFLHESWNVFRKSMKKEILLKMVLILSILTEIYVSKYQY